MISPLSNEKNKLYYFGTETEVLEGDEIIYKTPLLRRFKRGKVSYLPKYTGRELQQLKKNCDDWLLEFNDKTITGWLYSPEDLQPNKRIIFVSRGHENNRGISSSELEKMEQDMLKNTPWWDDLLVMVVSAVILFIILFLLWLFKP